MSHPFAEHRNLWPDDLRLRAHGFKIKERWKSDEAIWTRGGEDSFEALALAICQCEDEEKAKAEKEKQVA